MKFNNHGIIQFVNYKDYLEFEKEANHENNFIEERPRPWIDSDLEILVPYIKNKSYKILSVGTRDFHDLKYLNSKGYCNIVGVDLDSRCIPLAKKYQINFIQGDIHKTKIKNIDVIYCRHTLEHCYNPKLALQNMASFLNNDGIIMIVVPIEIELDIKKRRGHCVHWKTKSRFEKFCKKYFSEILCYSVATSSKKSQIMFIGRLQRGT